MSTNRKPFMPLDVDDDKLERLAAEKGVGKLEKPAQQSREGEGHSVIQAVAQRVHGCTKRFAFRARSAAYIRQEHIAIGPEAETARHVLHHGLVTDDENRWSTCRFRELSQ
jgi:hypothetical protein